MEASVGGQSVPPPLASDYTIYTLDTDTEIVLGSDFISDMILFQADIESIVFRCTATVIKWAGPLFKPCCNLSKFWLMDLVF